MGGIEEYEVAGGVRRREQRNNGVNAVQKWIMFASVKLQVFFYLSLLMSLPLTNHTPVISLTA